MSSEIKSKLTELRKMRDAIKDSNKVENLRRAKTLRQIYRKSNMTIGDKECKNLGDAIFILLAPSDAVILTTNITDHLPLAQAIGKVAVSPIQLLEKK